MARSRRSRRRAARRAGVPPTAANSSSTTTAAWTSCRAIGRVDLAPCRPARPVVRARSADRPLGALLRRIGLRRSTHPRSKRWHPARLSRVGRARGRAHGERRPRCPGRAPARGAPLTEVHTVRTSRPGAAVLHRLLRHHATAHRGAVADCTRATPRRSSSPPRCTTGSGRAISPRRSRRSRRARPGASPVMGTGRMPPCSM